MQKIFHLKLKSLKGKTFLSKQWVQFLEQRNHPKIMYNNLSLILPNFIPVLFLSKHLFKCDATCKPTWFCYQSKLSLKTSTWWKSFKRRALFISQFFFQLLCNEMWKDNTKNHNLESVVFSWINRSVKHTTEWCTSFYASIVTPKCKCTFLFFPVTISAART